MITHCLLIFRRSVAICVADAFLSFSWSSVDLHSFTCCKIAAFCFGFSVFFAVVLSLSFPCHILFEPASLSFYLEIRGDREDGKRVFACEFFSSFFEFAAVRMMGFFWRSPAVEATLHKRVSFVNAFFLRCFFFSLFVSFVRTGRLCEQWRWWASLWKAFLPLHF